MRYMFKWVVALLAGLIGLVIVQTVLQIEIETFIWFVSAIAVICGLLWGLKFIRDDDVYDETKEDID